MLFFIVLRSLLLAHNKMSSKSNLETEYLELNAKNEWPVLYQVIHGWNLSDIYTIIGVGITIGL